ncbi:MAG: class I SAM-dependent methyltransferase [Nitrospiraceae bacterium]
MRHVSTNELVGFLKSYYRDSPGILARSKAIYRPLICPFDRLLNLLPEGQRVLDIGCGAGVFLQLVDQYRNPSAIAGLETNQQAVECARRLFPAEGRGAHARLEVYDGTTLPGWIGEYDYVFMVDVLHHIPRDWQDQALRDLFAKLKVGARFIIKDIDAGQPFWCLFNKLHDLLLAKQYPQECDALELQCRLSHTGFTVTGMTKERIYVYPHYTIVAEKR